MNETSNKRAALRLNYCTLLQC
ncbi:TPA: hypothetical protein ANIA_11299 [Aspergillus nidulans FGSC A4]|uniref:Uncharacterized protein n=1 Tax=Emericella nidulans (strain FGSC A4 / ATCC 38163 / CBS 112.46 / NRRL 194 / M139) TaxID=227321 RepID=C8VS82_EMENI|nr:TPA: hypothetical protein ANIA_11299 [Aspergillus nidulans FGSC A4]